MDNVNLIPPKKAFLWLMASTLIISGTAFLALLYFRHVKELYANDEAYEIVAIFQSTSDKEGLKTLFLSELLNLSVDNPVNLYRFNSAVARKKLLAHPLIKEARIKKVRPGMILVDYSMRKPIAFLIDFENTAIDEEWFSTPFKPFFSPKKLPEIFLGIDNDEKTEVQQGEWGAQLKGKNADLAKEVFKHISEHYIDEANHLLRVDVSKAFAPSYGQRQIVVGFEHEAAHSDAGKTILLRYPVLLRLNTESYVKGLENYFNLKPELLKKGKPSVIETAVVEVPTAVIDLRLDQLAFVQSKDFGLSIESKATPPKADTKAQQSPRR